MNFKQKLLSIAKFADSITPDQNIVCSAWQGMNTNGIRDESQRSYGTYKPYGVWYSLGASWLDWIFKNATKEITAEYRDFAILKLREYLYFYHLDINKDIIKIIRNWKELDKFTKKYRAESWDDAYINWAKVAENYAGIEFHIKKESKKSRWYDGYDCYGGVIWNKRGVNKVTLLKEFEDTYKEIS